MLNIDDFKFKAKAWNLVLCLKKKKGLRFKVEYWKSEVRLDFQALIYNAQKIILRKKLKRGFKLLKYFFNKICCLKFILRSEFDLNLWV